MKAALTIAGLDPTGGAGIAQDLKTFAAMGVYGAAVITAVTAQGDSGVSAVTPLPPSSVAAQIDAALRAIPVGAVKIGMLADAGIVAAVAHALKGAGPVVVDPVFAATAGGIPLLDDAGWEALVTELLPRAHVVTPNLAEAERLAGFAIGDDDDALKACEAIRARGPAAVLLKGGHRGRASGTSDVSDTSDVADTDDDAAVDLLDDGGRVKRFGAARRPSPAPHGTGCVLSSAIAAGLAAGFSLDSAVEQAKRVVTAAIDGRTPWGRRGMANPAAIREG